MKPAADSRQSIYVRQYYTKHGEPRYSVYYRRFKAGSYSWRLHGANLGAARLPQAISYIWRHHLAESASS